MTVAAQIRIPHEEIRFWGLIIAKQKSFNTQLRQLPNAERAEYQKEQTQVGICQNGLNKNSRTRCNDKADEMDAIQIKQIMAKLKVVLAFVRLHEHTGEHDNRQQQRLHFDERDDF